jgi:hypothetical protein
MKTLKNLFVLCVALLCLSIPAWAQTDTTNTTLSSAVTSTSSQTVRVTSATGFTAGSTFAFVDHEQMEVLAVSGTAITVRRGSGSTVAAIHASDARIYVGPFSAFVSWVIDPVGACTGSNYPYLPVLNTRTGSRYNCVSSEWIKENSFTTMFTAKSATPGTYRQIRGEVTTYSTMTSGNLVGVRGAVTMPSSSTVSGGYLYGAQGKVVTGTGTFSGTSMAGIYGQLDVTGGTVSAGNVGAVQANIYGLTSGTSTIINGIYVESAGGGVMSSQIRMFGKATYVFDIETNVHSTEASNTCTPSAVTGATGGIHVRIDGTAKWIPLAATCS